MNISKSSKNPGREPASRHSIEPVRPHVKSIRDVMISPLSECFGIVFDSCGFLLNYGSVKRVADNLEGV